MRLLRPALAIALLATVAGAYGGSYFRWVEADGSEHLSPDAPNLGVPYERVEVPDVRRWINAPTMPAPHTAAQPLSTQALFRLASASVYALASQKASGDVRGGARQYGSAVAITESLALTNCHVIAGAGDEIYLGDGRESERAAVVAMDVLADRCVVSVSTLQLQPVAGVRGFDALEVGESVYAIGNPLRLARTLSDGLLSAKRENGTRRYLQTSAAISPGSSGGGLFDAYGNLVGITSFTLRGSQNINFAIPAEDFWN